MGYREREPRHQRVLGIFRNQPFIPTELKIKEYKKVRRGLEAFLYEAKIRFNWGGRVKFSFTPLILLCKYISLKGNKKRLTERQEKISIPRVRELIRE